MAALFFVTVVLSAGLLFVVQPMVGKMLLPLLGGVPAVWNTCLVFFQSALLIGYGYAHAAAARLEGRRRKTAADGWLVFHISSQHLDLRPVVASLARDAGWVAYARDDLLLAPEEREAGKDPSQWVVLAHTRSGLGALADDPRWLALTARAGARVWTDDFSNPWRVIRLEWGAEGPTQGVGRRRRPPGRRPVRPYMWCDILADTPRNSCHPAVTLATVKSARLPSSRLRRTPN